MNELILLAVNQNGGAPSAGCLGPQLLPLLLMFGVFYFLLIRPQQKRAKEHQAMLARLKKGDRVVTTGGLLGAIVKLNDSEIEIEIADRVKVRVLRPNVSLLTTTASPADAADSKDLKDTKELKQKGK